MSDSQRQGQQSRQGKQQTQQSNQQTQQQNRDNCDIIPAPLSEPARQALEKLKTGNELFVAGDADQGDVSHEARARSVQFGQSPYAVIVTCSDSRIVPDAVFSAGIGDLFVIRVAGNVIDAHQLGSIEYACKHLGTQLVVIMGHDHCGAVDAALHEEENHDAQSYIGYIVDQIQRAIGAETDPLRASRLNVEFAVAQVAEALRGVSAEATVVGALYCLETGAVEFFD